jgi:hypothetical protein
MDSFSPILTFKRKILRACPKGISKALPISRQLLYQFPNKIIQREEAIQSWVNYDYDK